MSNRTASIKKLHTLLKKRYKPVPIAGGRNLFEHFLFACVLQDGSEDAADEGIARLEQDYFDWNEVRVTTVSELAESLSRLPKPIETAARLKKNLHALFETYYAFDIDELKKQNLGKTIKELSDFPAMTPFILAYVVQQGLGGHAIPVNDAGVDIFYYCGIISESERQTGKVPGIERAIPKSKGREFSSILHQMSLDFAANPKDPELHKIITTVNPDAAELLPGKIKKASKAKKSSGAATGTSDAENKQPVQKKKAANSVSKGSKAPVKKPKTSKKTTAGTAASKTGAKAGKAAKKPDAKPVDKRSSKKTPRSATKKLAKKKPR